MFIQVITGTTSDPEGLRRQADRWEDELRPGAIGFLGSTGGVTEDGRFIIAARFESGDLARRNSEREDQSAWWAETEKYLSNVAFSEGSEILTTLGGGSNDAAFVQIMRGRVLDREKAAKLIARMGEFESLMKEHRPGFMGDVAVLHNDGTYTDIIYFTSEAAARGGEQKPMPAEAQEMFEEFMSTMPVDEYLDLKDPWLR